MFFEKYTRSPEILGKMNPNLAFQAKCQNFLTFFPISLDQMHIFSNQFLTYKGVLEFKKVKKIAVRVVQMKI